VQEAAKALQAEVTRLLPHQAWGQPGSLPKPGALSFEALQVAHYAHTQHFKPHEDGFPVAALRRNQFQRRATVLVYLNDVAEGALKDQLCWYAACGHVCVLALSLAMRDAHVCIMQAGKRASGSVKRAEPSCLRAGIMVSHMLRGPSKLHRSHVLVLIPLTIAHLACRRQNGVYAPRRVDHAAPRPRARLLPGAGGRQA
jgi:2OG-Fe(II) oxygenase superfamily